MTLLHVCDYATPYKGNFIPSLESLNGYKGVRNVYLFPYRANTTGALKWIDDLNKDGAVAYVQKRNVIANFFLLLGVLRQNRVDCVCKHFYDLRIDCLLKILFNSRKVLRFVHCMYDGAATSGWKHKLRRFFWRGNTLVGVSSAVSDGLKNPFCGFNVITIENGIFFPRLDGEGHFEFGEGIAIACMGYNVHVKGVDLALQAVNRVRKEVDVKLNIIAASHKDELVAFINRTFGSFPDWIRILPPINTVGDYLRGIDIFLSPSRTEAFSYAVLEAAYCGCAIVASRVGGQAKLDVEGVYWFDKEDVDGFATQLGKVIAEVGTEQWAQKAKKVSKAVQSRYSLESWRDNVLHAALSLTDGNR